MLCTIAAFVFLRVRRPDIAAHAVDPGAASAATGLRRRRAVVAGTLALGTSALAGTLAAPSGSGLFYGLGLLSAVAWIGGALLSGPIPWGRRAPAAQRDVVVAVLVAVALFVAFFAASLIAARVPALSQSVRSVLARADAGPRALVLGVALTNGVGEELFFRGALPGAIGAHHRALWGTAVYGLVTAATLNLALVVAALVMGTVFSVERRITGGVAAPILTHLSWSTLMLALLPR